MVDYINKLIEQDKVFGNELEGIKHDLSEVQTWIDNFSTKYAEKIIKECIATMIFVEISDAGYIVYYIPDSWKEIVFNTTGLDIEIENTEDNRLVLSY